jgi:hypothetical protein
MKERSWKALEAGAGKGAIGWMMNTGWMTDITSVATKSLGLYTGQAHDLSSLSVPGRVFFIKSRKHKLGASIQNPTQGSQTGHFIARVTHVVQGPYLMGTNVRDTYYNDPTDLGVITFQLLTGVQDRTLDSGGNSVAKPINSAFKQYPLEGEFVYIACDANYGLNIDYDQLKKVANENKINYINEGIGSVLLDVIENNKKHIIKY